jgi:hypothetical protein
MNVTQDVEVQSAVGVCLDSPEEMTKRHLVELAQNQDAFRLLMLSCDFSSAYTLANLTSKEVIEIIYPSKKSQKGHTNPFVAFYGSSHHGDEDEDMALDEGETSSYGDENEEMALDEDETDSYVWEKFHNWHGFPGHSLYTFHDDKGILPKPLKYLELCLVRRRQDKKCFLRHSLVHQHHLTLMEDDVFIRQWKDPNFEEQKLYRDAPPVHFVCFDSLGDFASYDNLSDRQMALFRLNNDDHDPGKIKIVRRQPLVDKDSVDSFYPPKNDQLKNMIPVELYRGGHFFATKPILEQDGPAAKQIGIMIVDSRQFFEGWDAMYVKVMAFRHEKHHYSRLLPSTQYSLC